MTQEEILQRAAEVAGSVAATEAVTADEHGDWMKNTMHAMMKTGLGGLVISGEAGGLGQGLLMLAQVCEVLGKESGSAGLCYGMHCVGSAVIAAKATDDQKRLFIDPICRGEHITTLALSEPGTGAHFYIPETGLLELNEKQYKVTGSKTFITNGSYADSYVVSTVAAEKNAPVDQFSCVVIPNDANGLLWGKPWHGLGMRGNSSLSLELKGVIIPANHILGEKGDQLWYVFNVVAPYFLMAMAGTYLGIAQGALEEARNHLANRVYAHSGQSLGQINLLQHRLGELWARVESTRRLLYYAAAEADKGNAAAIPALLAAKAEVGNTAVDVANEAMTLMGGMAYRDSSKMGRLLRDARAAHIMSPTTDILYTWIGRALLDMPLLSE
jgi:alkylation response protein AidB-like acyl-CoA dehydrogenase